MVGETCVWAQGYVPYRVLACGVIRLRELQLVAIKVMLSLLNFLTATSSHLEQVLNSPFENKASQLTSCFASVEITSRNNFPSLSNKANSQNALPPLPLRPNNPSPANIPLPARLRLRLPRGHGRAR